MSKYIIIGCVKAKRITAPGEMLPAADLYTSLLWQKRRRYAEMSGAPWGILSAAHGLIRSDEEIATYDTTIQCVKMLRRGRHCPWHASTAASLQHLVDNLSCAPLVVEVHAGAGYVRRLREATWLVSGEIEVVTPLASLGIGEQLRWYNAMAHTPAPMITRPEEIAADMRGVIAGRAKAGLSCNCNPFVMLAQMAAEPIGEHVSVGHGLPLARVIRSHKMPCGAWQVCLSWDWSEMLTWVEVR